MAKKERDKQTDNCTNVNIVRTNVAYSVPKLITLLIFNRYLKNLLFYRQHFVRYFSRTNNYVDIAKFLDNINLCKQIIHSICFQHHKLGFFISLLKLR